VGCPAEYAIKAKKQDENQAVYYYSADRNFIENMQLKFVAGQNLPHFKPDSASQFVVINEKAVQKLQLGTAREAIGKTIFINNQTEVQVVGGDSELLSFQLPISNRATGFSIQPFPVSGFIHKND
jgi:putative ABC transport system permease protein